MSVPIRPISRPISVNAFTAGLLGSAACWLWPSSPDSVVQSAAAWSCAVLAMPPGIKAAILLVKDYRLRKRLAQAQESSTDHGTGREAEWSELVTREMNDPASGNFLGLYESMYPAFVPPRTPFMLVEIPPGGNKTIAFVLGSILHQARLGKSLFIPDVKTELAPMLVAALRTMGIEVWCVNPAKMQAELCGDTELNLYQSVIDARNATGEFRRDTIKLALDLAELHLPEPKGGEDKNVYFRNGSRRCIAIVILALAVLDSARCTPSDVFALLNDPASFKQLLVKLRHEIVRIFPNDAVAEFLKTEAANLLDRFEHNAENAASFLEGATQSLIAFNQGGRMAGYGRTASVNIADMRKRQIIVFVMAPLSHARDFAPVVSLLNHSLLEAAKREPAGHPIHIVGEEALNYRFADIVSDMETMRGLKISADFYVQSFNGLVRKYGREAAAAIEAYADVKVYAGLNSFERAKHLSDMLAEATVRRQDFSFKADVADIGVSSREQGRRLMTPDEILAMDRGEAWVFVRGLRPMRLTMTDYGRIAPWRDEVAYNPLEGKPLRGEVAFSIRYADRTNVGWRAGNVEKPGITGVSYAARSKRHVRPRVWPISLRHLLWLPPLIAMWFVDLPNIGTPHLRFSATYTGSDADRFYQRCDYVGWHSRTLLPPDGRCPPVLFLSDK